MSHFQTLIRSRDSPLNIQTLILVVFIDGTMPMPELTNGLVLNLSCTNKTRKILLLIMYVVFLKITTFLWRILILHPDHTSLFLKLQQYNWGGGLGGWRGAEGREKQIPNKIVKLFYLCNKIGNSASCFNGALLSLPLHKPKSFFNFLKYELFVITSCCTNLNQKCSEFKNSSL